MQMSKRPMILLSIVERDKGNKLIKELENLSVRMHFQCVGLGTAPTEMMDIFGLGTKDKDIVISLGSEAVVSELMKNFGTIFESHSKYGGLMVVLKVSAASRILTELLSFNRDKTLEKGTDPMENKHNNTLIIVSVNEGFIDDVMHAARTVGATGGTVIKGRLANLEHFASLKDVEVNDERELLCILAPTKISGDIMNVINESFGITSPANGIVFALPTEKAYKI